MGIFVQGQIITDQKTAEAALTATSPEKFKNEWPDDARFNVWTGRQRCGLNLANVRIYEFTRPTQRAKL